MVTTTCMLTLTVEECNYLTDLLEQMLKETLIEEHRTRKPTYREYVLTKEGLIKAILTKLRPPAFTN